MRHRRPLSFLLPGEAGLLDAQLETAFAGKYGAGAVLGEYYLIPVLSDAGPTLQRVFGTQEVEQLPRTGAALQQTRLQRAILSFMRKADVCAIIWASCWYRTRNGLNGCYRRGFELLARDHFYEMGVYQE